MDPKANAINWFEICVNDINRAKKFYETVLDIKMEVMDMMGMKMAGFPTDPMSGKVGGAIVQGSMHKPGMDGTVIYLNGNPDLAVALGKIEGAGEKILMPKTQITPEIGYMAFFVDTEGNRMALHSQN